MNESGRKSAPVHFGARPHSNSFESTPARRLPDRRLQPPTPPHNNRYPSPTSIALNTITQADCADALPTLPAGSIDLAYLDPPFMTNRRHASTHPDSAVSGSAASAAEFNDRWPSLEAYLKFLRTRIALIHRALTPDGSILVHCDWRACHHIRIMLDEIFGPGRFVNHLIWKYGLGGSSPRRFARKHDDILFYARSDGYYFAPPRVPATSRRMQGQMKKATDVIAIPSINNQAHERVGYPTQKPLALLELLINACAAPSATVLDPFCGSGTTLLAAHKLGRQYIGFDINPDAVRIAQQRLAALTTHSRTSGGGDQKPPVRMTSRLLGKG